MPDAPGPAQGFLLKGVLPANVACLGGGGQDLGF